MPNEPRSGEASGDEWISIGTIARPHGLRGEFRVNPVSGDPSGFVHYREVKIADGKVRAVVSARSHKRQAILRVAGCDSIEAVQALIGETISIHRDALPEPDEDEYYWRDLVGCEVVDRTLGVVGTVTALVDFGAHDNLVVARSEDKEAQIPFVDAMVVDVDLDARRIEVDLPEGLLDV